MHPTVLALDTSTSHALVALGLPSGEVLVAGREAAQRHASALIPAIAGLLERGGMSLDRLDALAVGLGPGSFTGLRVGLTVAKTFTYVTGTRLVGLGSLDIVACNLRDCGRRPVVVADAQRGEWYVARFSPSSAGDPPRPRIPLTIEPAEAVLGSLAPDEVLLGPALDRIRSRAALPSGVPVLDPAADFPQAEEIIRLALDALGRGVAHDPMTLEPIYLRRSAAEEKADAAPARETWHGAGG